MNPELNNTGFQGTIMVRKGIIGITAALTTVILSSNVYAQESSKPVPAVQKAAATAPKIVDIESLEEDSRKAYADEKYVSYYVANMKLLEQRPYNPEYMQRVIVACAQLNRLTTAYHFMLKMQQQGFSYDLNQDPDTENIRNTEVYTHLNDLMIEAGLPEGEAETVYTLAGKYADSAAITWDETRGRFLVGTQSEGAIVALSDEGAADVLIRADDENGLWAIKGLHADAENNRLWVSSAAVPGFSAFQPTDKWRGALFEFNLETLELVNRFNLPVDGARHELGPMAVTDSGDVYIIDHEASVVYRKAADGDRLEVFVGSREMHTLRAIAVTPDNSRLFVSDTHKGVLVVDPVDFSSAILSAPENTNMGGISGLAYDRGHLFISQSGFQPERVMRLKLDSSGSKVVNVTPIASAREEFNGPGSAAIKGEHVYYFANLGGADASRGKKPTLVMRSPLSSENEAPSEAIQKAMEKTGSG